MRIVEAIGPGVTSVKVGDRVTIPFGTFSWSEKVLAPARGLFVVPPSVDAKTALKAAEIDKARREPRIYFLLAQIYEIERKPDAEAAQLQEYLTSLTDPQEVATVKKYLADLTGNRR